MECQRRRYSGEHLAGEVVIGLEDATIWQDHYAADVCREETEGVRCNGL